MVAWSGYGHRNVSLHGQFSEENALHLQACGYADFKLLHAAPVFNTASGRIAVLGEISKFVPVATARMLNVSIRHDGKLSVKVHGDVGEQIEIAFAFGSDVESMRVSYISTTVGNSGFETVIGPAGLDLPSVVV